MGRRNFGAVRRLPSGRWQARYRDRDGNEHTASSTFVTKADAARFLALVEADMTRGGWVDPRGGRVTLDEYAVRWLGDRPQLRPRTRELYEGLLRLHILPTLGELELANLSTSAVRTWHASRLSQGRPGPTTVAKCYRLLRTILATAVEDGLIVKNPCVIKGAGVERSAERPVATVAQVWELADAVGPRLRALVLTATFTGCRFGELAALTRRRVDLLHSTLTVTEQQVELSDGQIVLGPPKSAAGVRTIALPPVLIPELQAHLEAFALPGPDGLVFCGSKGAPLRRTRFGVKWRAVTKQVGLEGFHFHDLRHTGNTLAAATGASTKELMARMGHASPRAALLYQHATRERDVALAKALSELIAGAAPTRSAAVLPLKNGTAPPER